MSNIVEQFCISFLLEDSDARKREQLINWVKNSRLSTNVNKLLDVLNTQGITFEESEKVYNALYKKVLANNATETFLSMEEAGNAKYCEFVSENLLSSKSIRDAIKKEKLTNLCKTLSANQVNY